MLFRTFSELLFLCLYKFIDPSVPNAFKQFLKVNGDTDWWIVSDYHMEKKEPYKNDVFVFTVLPASQHFIQLDQMEQGLPSKLSATDVSDSDIQFLKQLNHFTFVFVSDKTFRPAAPSLESVRESLDITIRNTSQWKNAPDYEATISRYKKIRIQANSRNFNLRLFNSVVLASGYVASILSLIAQTLKVENLTWLSDRDAIVNYQDGIAYDLVRHNLNSFYKLQPFNFIWSRESPEVGQKVRKAPLVFAPYLRIPDYFAAPAAVAQLHESGYQHTELNKYQRILSYVIADSSNVALLRLVNEPGWGHRELTERERIHLKVAGRPFS